MRSLHIAHIEVVVGEDRTAHGTDEHRAVLNAKLIDGLRQHLVHVAVAAAGAVVGLVLHVFLAVIALVEGMRLGVGNLVFGNRFADMAYPLPSVFITERLSSASVRTRASTSSWVTVSVDWGDGGDAEDFLFAAGATSFDVSHLYDTAVGTCPSP